MAYKEIYNMLETAGTVAQNLSKQAKEGKKNYEIS